MRSKVWIAAELEPMSPSERQAIFDSSIVTDLDSVPPEFLTRVRDRIETVIKEADPADRE